MTETASKPLWKVLVKRVLQVLAALVLLLLLFQLVMWPLALSKEKSAEKKWAAAGTPLKGFFDQLPKQENNAAAEKLCIAAEKLGLNLRFNDPGAKGEKKETSPSENDWKAVSDAVRTYGSTQLEKAEPSVEPPPEDLAAYLTSHSSDLSDVRAILLGGERLRWIQDLSKGYAAPIPNFLGQIDLTRLLVADAMAAKSAGDSTRALQDMDAIWKLSEGDSDRVELISQLIVIAVRKMAVAGVRKLDGVPDEWQRRLGEWDPQKDIERSYTAEAAVMGNFRGIIGATGDGDEKLLTFLGLPYLRLSAASAQEILLSQIQDFQKLGPCAKDEDLVKCGESLSKKIPRWNPLAGAAIPNISSSWARVKHLKIQVELTQKVLALKAQRASDGTWPAPVEGIEKSFCQSEKWVYAPGQDGSMSLIFSGPPLLKDLIKGNYPQEYKEGPRQATKPKGK